MSRSKELTKTVNILLVGSIILIIVGGILGIGELIIVGIVLLVITSCFKYIRF